MKTSASENNKSFDPYCYRGEKHILTDVMDEKRLTITIKGKGKATEASEAPSPPPEDCPRIKKPKRAETRPCPVCDELIPLRLMALHSQLEAERVDEIIKQVGSSEPILLADEFDDLSYPGLSVGVRSRRSAMKAMKSFASSSMSSAVNEELIKTMQTIQRRRKQRHARFKEMAREEEGYSERPRWSRRTEVTSNEVMCPVCSQGIRGDQEVINAHVDSCLVDESRRLEGERARRAVQDPAIIDEDNWGGMLQDGVVGHIGNVRGTGFHTRDPTSQDIEDEVDIDGDDQDKYGEVQFTESDILPVDANSRSLEAEEGVLDGDQSERGGSAQQSLRDLIAEGKNIRRQGRHPNDINVGMFRTGEVEKLDLAIAKAKQKGVLKTIVVALEDKIKYLESLRISSTSLLCRICLDTYNEPTVSTGCWHACCRECWLRCLGSTKLCPICKRITEAADLRRIYL